jgi:aminoglycoside phosphotransferase (APT) family kinase protein
MCAYRHPALDLVQGKPSSWTSARLPSPHTLAGQYEAAGGASLADWDFHLALAYFKIAVIAAGIDFRFRAGSGSGPGFSTARDAVLPFMSAGLEASTALAR